MQISLFTIVMTFIWSSILIILFYYLRKKLLVLEVCSVSGTVAIYLFCILRLCFPIEFPWTIEVNGGYIWNHLRKLMDTEVMFIFEKKLIVSYFVLIVWLMGAFYKLLRILFSYSKFNQYIQLIPKDRVMSVPSYGGKIDVYKSQHISRPCAAGIVNKKIFLPDRTYTEKQKEYILMHEIVHHKNQDLVIKLFCNILCAVYWWNPFVYLLKKDLNQSLELRCDQGVIKYLDCGEKSEYLQVILDEFKYALDDRKKTNEYLVSIVDSCFDTILERFQMVSVKKHNTSIGKRLILIGITAIIILCSYSFVIQSEFEAPTTEMSEAIYFDESNSYIVQKKSGEYQLVTPEEVFDIDVDEADFYIENGFEIKVEE